MLSRRPLIATLISLATLALAGVPPAAADNPIIKDRFTADAAALVFDGRLYLYTGHDEAKAGAEHFYMRDWCCFSSDDMVHWKDEGTPLSLAAFEWADRDAWASQVIERDGKFYWYARYLVRFYKAFVILTLTS